MNDMATSRIAVSPTKLDTWQDCPRRYWLRYVRRVKVDGRWAHLSMGNAVHAGLREWFDLPCQSRRPEDGAALVAKAWSTAGFRDAEQSDLWQGIASRMVVDYASQHSDCFPHSSERTLGSLTENATLTGRIDRLDEAPAASADPDRDGHPGELVVVDYKTGRKVPSDDDARVSRALAIYCEVVTRSLRRPALTVQLHHVPTGVIASARHTPDSIARQVRRVDSLARDMSAAQGSGEEAAFPPQPGPLCSWCDYREHCSAGGDYDPRPRWAGLPESDEDSVAHASQP